MKKISILIVIVYFCTVMTNVNHPGAAKVSYVAYSAAKAHRVAQSRQCGEPGEDAFPDPPPPTCPDVCIHEGEESGGCVPSDY